MLGQPDFYCEKHNSKIINTVYIGKEVAWQCQFCINEQQKPVQQFFLDFLKLAEEEKTRLLLSQKEREERYKVLKKIMINCKDEVCSALDAIIHKIDQQIKKTQKQIHDQIESINDQDKQVIGKNYARLCEDLKINYQQQKFIQDNGFKNTIYQMLLEVLQKAQQWSNYFNEQWKEIQSQQNIIFNEDHDVDEYASTSTQRNWYKNRKLSARPGTSEKKIVQVSSQTNNYKIQSKVPAEFKQARPKQ